MPPTKTETQAQAKQPAPTQPASTPTAPPQAPTANPAGAPNEQQFLLALKNVMNQVYQDGIEQILNWSVDEAGNITGQFRDGGKAFQFTLNTGGLEYSPIQPGKNPTVDSAIRVDAIAQYPSLEGKSIAYMMSFLGAVRQDKSTQRNCTSATAYSCGATCINNKKVCRVNASAIANPKQIAQLAQMGKQIKSSNPNAGAAPNPMADFAQSAGALGQKTAGIVAGAALLGLPVATFAAFRGNYRKGFEQSVELAKQQAQSIEVEDIPNEQSHITFTIGGFSGNGKGGERLKEKLGTSSLGLKDHHFVPVSNEEFDVRTMEEFQAGKEIKVGAHDLADFAKRGMATFLRTNLKQGRNPVAVKIAAQAYAYHQKYPDRPISLVGHSAGGIASHEAAEILNKMGVKSQVLAIASPHFGLTEPTEKSMTIATRKDPIVGAGNVMNANWINSVAGHDMEDYFASDEVHSQIRNFLGGSFKDENLNQYSSNAKPAKMREKAKSRKDAWRIDKRCSNGKPCGATCIAKGFQCNFQLSSQAIDQLDEARSAITRLKTPIAVVGAIPAAPAIAAFLGIPVAAYLAAKAKYQAGFAESAEIAKTEAASYQVPEKLQAGFRSIGEQTPDAKTIVESKYTDEEPEQITFFVGGMGGVKGKEGDYMGEEFSAMFPKHQTVAIESAEFDLVSQEGDTATNPDYLKRAIRTIAGPVIEKGRNPVAVRIAARAYAYHQKYPNKPINLVGQSGGTMPTREAAEILERMGVKDVRVVSSAGPYLGLTKARGVTLAAEKDNLRKMLNGVMVNQQRLSTIKGHTYYYTNDGPGDAITRAKMRKEGQKFSVNTEVQEFLTGYFDRSQKSKYDAAEAPEATPEQVQLGLKNLIGEAYRGGIERVLSAEVAEGDIIKGQFKAENEVFNFEILPTGKISYIEASEDKEGQGEPASQTTQPPVKAPVSERQDTASISLQKQLYVQLKTILERAYQDGIDQFLNVEIADNGDISGRFRDGGKVIQFSIGDRINYKLVKQMRGDSYREDRSRKPRCEKGISCGAACIAGTKSCIINSQRLASPQELQTLRQTAQAVSPSTSSAPKDDLDGKNIRDLKKMAADKSIYRYSHMTSEELKDAIRASNQNPEQQERIRKTFQRNKEQREAIEKTVPGWFAKYWKDLAKLSKIAGVNPELAAAAVAVYLSGVAMKQWQQVKDKYQENLNIAAENAMTQAEKENAEYTPRGNVTFAVGGFSGTESTGQRVKDLLEAPAGPGKDEEWFSKQHQIIAIDSPEFDIPEPNVSKKNPDGSYNPLYLGHMAKEGFGQFLKNFQRGNTGGVQNQASVDLAAKIFAYAKKYPDKQIHIVAHGAGGLTAREAADILSRMKPPSGRGLTGRDVVNRLNVVSLGTPYFGVSENVGKQQTITSSQDPFSMLPKRNEKWISSIPGHEVEDYLTSPEAREQLRTFLGYYKNTAYQREKVAQKEAAKRKKQKAATTPEESPAPNKPKPKPKPKKKRTDAGDRGTKSLAYWEAYNAALRR